MAKRFYPILEEDKVYIVSGGKINMSNKRFTTIPNDYCISFNDSTKFDPAEEDSTIGNVGFAFKTISSLSDLQTRSSCDVIGIITDVMAVSSIKLKSGEEKDKRTITIMDDTRASVDVTFWGASAHA
jgi:replication factor A1